MNPPPERPSIRLDARLDQAMRQKVDDFAHRFHQSRAAVVCYIMRWGLNREPAALLT